MLARVFCRSISIALRSISATFLFIGAAFAIEPVTADPVDFQISEQPLNNALNEFARQSDREIFYASDVVDGIYANGIDGNYEPEEALELLLADSGLEYSVTASDTFLVNDQRGASDSKNSQPTPVLMAQNQTPPQETPTSRSQATTIDVEDDDEVLEQIIVTGSRIRGAQNASPVVTITRAEIDMAGYATVEEVIENLPQNFGAGATSDATNPTNQFQAVGGQVSNFAGGTSINLRGLGTGSTLVLLNGRRMSPSGFAQRFTDISSIPVSAIERVEVLTDGASAVYGADAIGGVVNFILRDSYDGAETRLRYGSDSGGDTSSVQFGQSLGTSWDTGNVLLTYEYNDREALAAADRSFTASNDLSPFGGTDWRQPGGNPANIRIGSFPNYVFYAIPEGQDGTALTAADFMGLENTQYFFNAQSNVDTIPASEQHSAFLHLRQMVASVELFGAARYSNRKSEHRFVQGVADFTVQGDDPATPDIEGNPWFVDPTGTGLTTVTIDNYALFDDFGPAVVIGEIETTGATLGAQFEYGEEWRGELVGNWSKEDASNWDGNRVDRTALAAAVNQTDPNLAFNPFGDGSNTNSAVIESVVDRRLFRSLSENELWSVSFNIDGDIFDAGGGAARIAAGVDFREESLSTLSISAATGDSEATNRDRDIFAAYGELFLPLVSDANRRKGIERLEISLAARYEEYSDFGDTINPKLGILWSPTESVAFRGTIGTSYRAPALVDLDDSDSRSSAWIYIPDFFGLPDSVLFGSGRNSDLQAEEATTWTAGIQWRAGGLSIDATYFHIDFEDRIETPSVGGVFPAAIDPRFASIRNENPTSDEIAAIANDPRYQPDWLSFAGVGPYTAADLISGAVPVGMIIDNFLTNLARSVVTGLELQFSYVRDTELGLFNIGLNGSYLFDYERQLLTTDPLVDEIDTLGRPVDLRARGNLGWGRAGWSVTTFVNYMDGYTDNVSTPDRSVDAWTTVDMTIAYKTQRTEGFFSDIRMGLTTQNLFDEDPPFVDTSGGVGYDATNANPLGRYFSFQITKDW